MRRKWAAKIKRREYYVWLEAGAHSISGAQLTRIVFQCVDLSREGTKVQRLEDDLLWSRDQARRLEQLIESANSLISEDIAELEIVLDLGSSDCALTDSFSESFDKNGSTKGDSWIATLRVSYAKLIMRCVTTLLRCVGR